MSCLCCTPQLPVDTFLSQIHTMAFLVLLPRVLLLLTAAFTFTTAEPTSTPVPPHITDCFSSNMETFRCRWSSGSYNNLSDPGALRLFYLNKPLALEWQECPQYSPQHPNECFFSEQHTTVWNSYRVQLRSRDQRTVFDESTFNVYDRVRPDPPYNVSWDVLNDSVTGQFYDVMVSWSPPESADVRSGWMRLQYQLQHRDFGSELWKESDVLDSTQCSVFGLHSNVQYEVRVRCKMFGMKFGEFSKPILIYQPSNVSRFPVAALLIFGTVCLVSILMLVIISRQEKLMVLLLPPIPGPKIRGINPELLKKGKLRELTSILGPSELRPELYDADPWVEFIELDLEEHQAEPLTHCMLPGSIRPLSAHDSTGFRDDDSGRASCCEPDLHSDTESSPSHPNTPDETADPSPNKETMYTQVSEVRPSGKVVLSPEDTETHVMQKPSPRSEEAGYALEVHAGKMSQEADMSLPAAPVYTMVEVVGGQNSLLLTPSATHLLSPKPTPEGYLAPDLLASISS